MASRFIAPHLAEASYNGVEPLETIAKEIGLPVEQLIKLNANENVYGLPEAVQQAVANAEHHVYPDPAQVQLRAAVAKLLEVQPENICCGAGSDDILDIVIRMNQPKAMVTSIPTFGMYKFLGSVANVPVVNVKRKDDFTLDMDAIIAAIRDNEEDALIVMDEAYAEFCDSTSMSLFGTYPNLLVARTFSKWAGLAGLRLGYCVADAELIKVMMAIKQPYNVNTAADAAGLAALEHRDTILKTVAILRAEKDRLYTELTKVDWLRPVPSDANFVLVEVQRLPAQTLYQGGDLSNYVRISAGKPEQMDAVLAAIKAIEKEYHLYAPIISM
ncbi:uncharacterized protein MONBRDRAFT_39309 [Monosiga brevicollis MX1]|uniref:histidinol-phosphate transaminase n=1 Tax=Monosiga brevicollis TaxID=81824 RepID=A9VDN0_MONBE|nr:uncharacterized protein MONBRDRAFT_39309 [Monosiga brevicollis MX1]EDQ84329.1 predicted protein [Monosiga brevicollis MX1]|eukprot:XP_001750825.1 hypothetical protein [Monosiga brevicollis MX1]